MNDLTLDRKIQLAECEAEIVIGLEHIEHEAARIGKALRTIRDERLYKPEHASFLAYLRSKEHWMRGRSRAYQLIDYVAVTEDLSTAGGRLPNERQARELVPLTPDQRQEVWTEATADGAQPTAARLHELANRTLAGLPPEEQQETVEQAEVAVLERQEPPQDEVRAGKIERALKWLMRAWAEIESLSDDTADAVLRVLDTVVSAAKALREE